MKRVTTINNRLRHMIVARIAFVAAFLSMLALLLCATGAAMTEGQSPSTALEWIICASWSVLVWPVFAAGRLFDVGSPGFIIWISWFLGALFWALLIELFIFTRHEQVAQPEH